MRETVNDREWSSTNVTEPLPLAHRYSPLRPRASPFACSNGTRTAVCIGINNRPRYRIRCQAMHSTSYRRHAPRGRSGNVADTFYHHGRQQQTGVRGYQKRWCAHQRAPIILTDDLFHLSTSPSLGRAKLSVLGPSQSCECLWR